MGDLLASWYPWTKSLHVISVIAWMAGLFYLPRLYVYHVEQAVKLGTGAVAVFQTMEAKLLRVIMGPAAVASWLFGLMLVLTPGVVDWSALWPWTKAAAVIAMTGFHLWLARERKRLLTGTTGMTGRGYRLMNELPTLLMVVIVVSVIARPW